VHPNTSNATLGTITGYFKRIGKRKSYFRITEESLQVIAIDLEGLLKEMQEVKVIEDVQTVYAETREKTLLIC